MTPATRAVFDKFRWEAEPFGIPVAEHHILQFQSYLEALREWNRHAGLVSRDDPETVIWIHFFDSITPYPLVKHRRCLLDFGSGAGFPGIPLKILLPEIRLHLLEANRRKANFLKYVARRLNLTDTHVHHIRLRQDDSFGPFPAVIGRAITSPGRWLPDACRVLEKGGEILLMLGPHADREELAFIAAGLELEMRSTLEFQLPVVHHDRRIVVFHRLTVSRETFTFS